MNRADLCNQQDILTMCDFPGYVIKASWLLPCFLLDHSLWEKTVGMSHTLKKPYGEVHVSRNSMQEVSSQEAARNWCPRLNSCLDTKFCQQPWEWAWKRILLQVSLQIRLQPWPTAWLKPHEKSFLVEPILAALIFLTLTSSPYLLAALVFLVWHYSWSASLVLVFCCLLNQSFPHEFQY